MNLILWQTEQELLQAKNEISEKNQKIQELNDELYVSDLEVQELREILEKAHNVRFIYNLLVKIKDLQDEVYMNQLEIKDMQKIIDQSSDTEYLTQLNDRNDKLMNVNRHLMENIYKGKVLYM
jgi:hypothetical protein